VVRAPFGALGTLVHPLLTGPAAQEGCATDLKLGAAALGAPSIQSSPVRERKRQFSSVALSLFLGKSQEYVISGHSVLFCFPPHLPSPPIPSPRRRRPHHGLIEGVEDIHTTSRTAALQHTDEWDSEQEPRDMPATDNPTTKHHYRHHEREESHEAAGIPPISATTAGPATWFIAVPKRHRGGGGPRADHHGPRSP
jgi:hypothetical protein